MVRRGRALRGRGRVGIAGREIPRSGRSSRDEFAAGEVPSNRDPPTHGLDEIEGLGLQRGRPTPRVAEVSEVSRRGAPGRGRGVSARGRGPDWRFGQRDGAQREQCDDGAQREVAGRGAAEQWEDLGATPMVESQLIDLEVASGIQSNFKKYLMTNKIANVGINLSVTVLTSKKWPSYKTSCVALSVEMVKCVEVYEEFYKTITKQRRLTWIHSLGTCNIVGKFDAKPIELIVTTCQAVVLLLFNVEDIWSYNDIKNQVNLPDEDVIRLLHSLSCATYKILKKDPNTKVVGQDDLFGFNTKFTNKMRRIKVQVPLVDEKQRLIEDIIRDRRYTIDAIIVRIMKSRKQLPFQQLLVECVEQLRGLFEPDVKVIKKRVEDMITREFLERDSENLNILKYSA